MKRFLPLLILLNSIGVILAQQNQQQHHTHGHHVHKTLHPHMHLHQKNYLNSVKLTGGLGTGTYYGDLCDNFDCFVFRPQINVGANYRINQRFLVRGELLYTRLAGKDDGKKNASRNLDFRSNNVEFSIGGVFDIIKFEPLFFKRADFIPYLHAGIGLMYFNPRTTIEIDGKKDRVNLRPLKTENVNYSPFTMVIPFGFGVRMKMTDHLDICGEVGYRKTFTDYLDDVSTKYVIAPPNSKQEATMQQLAADKSWEKFKSDDEWAAVNSKGVNDTWKYYSYTYEMQSNGEVVAVPVEGQRIRGNSKKKDGYFLFMIKAEYTIKVTKQRGVNINRMYNPRFRTRRR